MGWMKKIINVRDASLLRIFPNYWNLSKFVFVVGTALANSYMEYKYYVKKSKDGKI